MEMGDLFEGYLASLERPGRLARPYDEVFDTRGDSYDHYGDVVSVVAEMSSEDLAARALRLARAFMDQGVTFDLDGEERPFPLDVVPRIFTTKEWQIISDGVGQRVRALEAFLDDIYNSARILHDGLIPHHLITSSPGFLRSVKAVNPPNGVRIQVAGIDIVRDEDGSFAVLEDNLRSPSGVSYVLANRAAMARVLPEIFWGQQIQLVADYPARLVQALRRAAPAGVVDPTVVVLTPGVYNSAFYEHALLARLMGVHLVEGRDLTCHGVDVYLQTTDGEVPVHVIYRRVDDEYLDPLQFRPESLVGCPGLVNAARAGSSDGCERDRKRHRRRQARLCLRARHDPLLPRRGSHLEQRRYLPADRLRRARASLQETQRARVQAGGRIGWKGHADRPLRERRRTRRDGASGALRPSRLDCPENGVSFDLSDVDRRTHRPAARGPAAVRGERRREDLGHAGGPHPGRAARGEPRGQLVPGWGVEGHLGHRGIPRAACSDGFDRHRPERRPSDGHRASSPGRRGPATATTTAAMKNALLSRVAESIFWVGRYVERAEGTARILDVVVYQALEQSSSEASSAAARRLLAVMGMPDDESASLWEVTELLATRARGRDHPSPAHCTRLGRTHVPSVTWCP